MVLKLIAEQDVICKKCGQTVNYEHSSSHVCSNDTAPVPEQPPAMAAPLDPTQTLQQVLEDAQAGNFSPEAEKICTAYVRSRIKNAQMEKLYSSRLVERKLYFFICPVLIILPSPYGMCSLYLLNVVLASRCSTCSCCPKTL